MQDATYTVPNRFGLRAVLLVVSIFAVVFTLTKAIHVELRAVAPVLSFVVLICVAQMAFGWIPRTASAAVGGLVFPLSAYINPFFDGKWMRLQPIGNVDLFWLVTCGLIAGYLGGALLAGIFLLSDCLQTNRARRVYAMPRRFGLGTILVATAVFAVLFAALEYTRARPWELIFYASFVATVALSQALLHHAPRWASILAGGVYLPLSIWLFGSNGRRWGIPRHFRFDPRDGDVMQVLILAAVIGLLIGYLGGALIAGVFLVSDYIVRCVSLISRRRVNVQLADEESLPAGNLTLLAEQAAAARRKLM
jgi:hypothetical protein